MDYERLISEHDRIDEVSCEIMELARSPKSQAEAASAALCNLALLVSQHLSDEDAIIYPTYLKMQSRNHEAEATEIVAELEALKEDWQQYLGDWTADNISSDWAGFCDESLAMLSRLRARVRRETGMLYPIALQHGVINLRSPRSDAA